MARGLHLDLKGMPPTAEHLPKLLRLIAAAGYDTVLVEWEDTFCWSDQLGFSGPTAYTRGFIDRFHETAVSLGLQVVALVQTLGHMEMALRHPKYAALREVDDRPDVLNVLHPEAPTLVRQMIREVAEVTPPGGYLHLGGDEAWTFGDHPQTSAYIDSHGGGAAGRAALYLHHYMPLLEFVRDLGFRPLLWHDMLVDWSDESIKLVAEHADLVCWGYTGHPDTMTDQHYSSAHIQRFHRLGVPLWGATAYKGAGRGNSDVPNLADRCANAEGWMQLAGRCDFKGMFVTGWSRHSAGSMQTDPIDAALADLVVLGSVITTGRLLPGDHGAASTILSEVGLFDIANRCRAAALDLSDAREKAWHIIGYLHEQLLLDEIQEPIRRNGWAQWMLLRDLNESFAKLQKAADRFTISFSGLADPAWINEYLRVRVEPVCRQLDELRLRASAAGSSNLCIPAATEPLLP